MFDWPLKYSKLLCVLQHFNENLAFSSKIYMLAESRPPKVVAWGGAK